jgi:hypothetical protein
VSTILNDSAIDLFFRSEEGPLGRYIARKAAEITTHAHNNLVPHVRSGDAIQSLRFAGIFQDPDALFALVGTDAAHAWKGHEPFNYPIALELGGVTPSGAGYHYPFLGPAVEASGFVPG